MRRGSTNSSKQDSLKLKTGLSQVADSAQSTPSVSWSNIDRNKVLGKQLAHEEDLVILSDDEDDEVESYSSGDGDGLKDNDYDGAELTAQFLEDEDEDERLGGDCFGKLKLFLDCSFLNSVFEVKLLLQSLVYVTKLCNCVFNFCIICSFKFF